MSNQVPQIRFNGYHDAWEKRKLSNVVSLLGGNAFKSKDSVTEEGVRWLKIANVSNSGIKWNEESFLPSDYWERYPNYRIVAGDYVMALTRPIIAHELKIAKMPLGSNALLNQRVAKLIWNMNADFGFQLLRKRNVVDYIEQTISGTDPPNLSGNTFEKIMVSVPETVEQEKIGRFLETVDNLLAVNQRKLDLLKEQKKGYLQKMFPKNGAKAPELRFAGFADDWEERKLGEVGKAKSGIGFSDAQQGGKQGTPFYKVSDMNNPGNEVVMMSANNYASDSQLRENKWNPITPQNSGVVFAKVGAAIFLDRKRIVDTSFLIDNNMMSYLFDSSWNRYFGKTLFEKLRLSRFAQVGALPSFNGSDVEDIKVMIPEESEQKVIGDMFEKLDETIALHQRKLDLLKEQKKGFLQKTFV